MNVNFELYKVFYMVAVEGSFSKAARRLFISQSAVSQNIRQLETKLSTRLFNRQTKQVGLTAEGQALMHHIEPAVHMILKGEAYLKETKTLSRGQLHIAASDTICKHYLLDYFKAYHDAYPGIDIKVTNRTSVQCVELLRKDSVDFIITNLPNAHIDGDMTALPIRGFQDVFIAAPGRLTDGPYTLERLAKEPVLMLTKKTATSAFLYGLFEAEGITINPAIELGSIDLLMDMTRIGLGISFVPDFCVAPSGGLAILPLTNPLPMRHIGLVTHNKRPLSVASQKFIELLVN